MSSKLEPVICYWSRNTLVWQVSINHNTMSNIKGHGKPRLHVSVSLLFGHHLAQLVRHRPCVKPLAMITMIKSTHGFPFLPYMSIGLRLVAHGLKDLLYYIPKFLFKSKLQIISYRKRKIFHVFCVFFKFISIHFLCYKNLSINLLVCCSWYNWEVWKMWTFPPLFTSRRSSW